MTLMDSESWDAMCEETKRTIRNVKAAQKSERDRIIKIIRNMHGVGSYEGKFLIRKDDLIRAIRKDSLKTGGTKQSRGSDK